MKKIHKLLITVAALSLLLASCAPKARASEPVNKDKTKPVQSNFVQIDAKQKEITIDYQKVKPNENGQIMILMYHGIGSKEEEWVRTAENFRKDLETLYQKGYRLISLKDYLNNDIKVAAGFTPFILTFDDGLQNQFNFIEENGHLKIDPNCAVGIIEDFKKRYPDFGSGGSFFVYYPVPFRQKDLIKQKYEFLINNGYEIGNHGFNHEDLGKASTDSIQKSLAENIKKTKEFLPDYEVISLALPYGNAPKGDDFKYVVSGEYEGLKYHHKAILRVGSNPAFSPIDIRSNFTKLPRVRGSDYKTDGVGLYDWLNYFDKNPHNRYISDGDSNSIVIPETELKNINRQCIGDKKLITYTLKN